MDIKQILFSVTSKNISNLYANKHKTPFYEKQRTTLIRNVTRHRGYRVRVAPRILEKKLIPEKKRKTKVSGENVHVYTWTKDDTKLFARERSRRVSITRNGLGEWKKARGIDCNRGGMITTARRSLGRARDHLAGRSIRSADLGLPYAFPSPFRQTTYYRLFITAARD